MNKELFASMREQMAPSGEARAALAEKLAASGRKTITIKRYAVLAACAAVIVAAVPVYGMVRDHLKWQLIMDSFQQLGIVQSGCTARPEKPHSYSLADDLACWPEDSGINESSTAADGAGDQDQDMTPGEVADNMLEAGFSQEDVDAYLASGWQMTWAKWWKFYHQSEETGDRTLEALLDFSREEGLTVNTGEAPAEIPVEVPDQGEAVMAYQNLMAQFEADYGLGVYPEWYGGAYIDEHAGLIVNIVEACEPEDKELSYQICGWAGSDRIGFGSCQFSLNQLRELQSKAMAAMEQMGLDVGCGIDEEAGQVELTLPVVTEEALWRLAELDPADTAIRVVVGQFAATDLAEEPALIAPSVSNAVQPGGDALDPSTPVSNTDGVIVDEDGVIAWEPQE